MLNHLGKPDVHGIQLPVAGRRVRPRVISERRGSVTGCRPSQATGRSNPLPLHALQLDELRANLVVDLSRPRLGASTKEQVVAPRAHRTGSVARSETALQGIVYSVERIAVGAVIGLIYRGYRLTKRAMSRDIGSRQAPDPPIRPRLHACRARRFYRSITIRYLDAAQNTSGSLITSDPVRRPRSSAGAAIAARSCRVRTR